MSANDASGASPGGIQKLQHCARKWTVRVGLAAVILPIPIFAVWTLIALNFTYSEGERVGFVQKIGERGWLCKTIEGELAQVQMPGQPAQIFPFTVRAEKVQGEINALAGHKVVLKYEQHRGIPSSCFGDTEYFVVGVRKAD
jgi:hypothetical protein